jgi:hypothetical protein
MDVFAIVSGYSNQWNFDDFTDYLHGSFLSSTGGLMGDLRAQLVHDYAAFIASNGLRQDLDGDGDLDVGSNNDPSLANFFRAYIDEEAPRIPEAKIATLTWTRAGDGVMTLVNFRPRNDPLAAQWAVDGVPYDPTAGPFEPGAPVEIIYVPESSSSLGLLFSLTALLGGGVLARGNHLVVRFWLISAMLAAMALATVKLR